MNRKRTSHRHLDTVQNRVKNVFLSLFTTSRMSLFCVELDRKSSCAGLSLEVSGLRYFLSGFPFTKRNSRPCCFRLASRASQNAYEDCLMRNRNADLSPCQCSRLEVERTTAFLKHGIVTYVVHCTVVRRVVNVARQYSISCVHSHRYGIIHSISGVPAS